MINPMEFQNEDEANEATEWAGAGCAAPRGSADPIAVEFAAMRANVKRYYDLCVVVREAKEEMKLLNEQFKDISNDAINKDAVEWIIEGRDLKAMREWEAEHPQWTCAGNGIRKRKQND